MNPPLRNNVNLVNRSVSVQASCIVERKTNHAYTLQRVLNTPSQSSASSRNDSSFSPDPISTVDPFPLLSLPIGLLPQLSSLPSSKQTVISELWSNHSMALSATQTDFIAL